MNTYLSHTHKVSFATMLFTRPAGVGSACTAEVEQDENVASRLDAERRAGSASPRSAR